MLRLLEEQAREPLQRRGQRLLETGREADLPPEVQRRVRAAIDAHQLAKGARTHGARLRPRTLALAAVLLLFSATGALAALGNDWVDRVVIQPVVSIIKSGRRHVRRPARAAVERDGAGERRAAPGDAPGPTGAPVQTSSPLSTTSVAAAAASVLEPTNGAPAHATARRLDGERCFAPSRPRWIPARDLSEEPEGSGLVFGAMVALRRDHDPARAGTLLDRYLARAGKGPLREEAMALAVEAAVARHDSAALDRWSRAYLRAYPKGRFNQFVRATTAPRN